MTDKSVRVARNVILVLLVWFVAFASVDYGEANEAPLVPAVDAPEYCPPYRVSALFRERRDEITIDINDDWTFIVENSRPGTDILFSDGVYDLSQELVRIGSDVTLRSASGDRDSVLIRGAGYRQQSQGLVIAGDRVTIADISITQLRDHGIFVKPAVGGGFAPHIYNVHVFDIGTQHVKSNSGSRFGIIACSTIGYTESGAVGDYNGAIDLHGATAWSIRDNDIYNIAGDGSGCNVNRDCGRYVSSPAILVWNQSRDTVVERNRIRESYRNIAFGLGRGHSGGIIRNNTIVRASHGDAGIELQGAQGVTVENNAVLLYDRYRGAIEYRDSSDIVVRSNRLSTVPWDRGRNNNVAVSENSVVAVPETVRKRVVSGCSRL